MESFQEYLRFVDEINQGMEDVKRLRESCSPDQEAHVDRMLASYKDAVSTLDWDVSQGQGKSERMCSDTSITGASYKDFVPTLDGNAAQSRGTYKRSRDSLIIEWLNFRDEPLTCSIRLFLTDVFIEYFLLEYAVWWTVNLDIMLQTMDAVGESTGKKWYWVPNILGKKL